MLSMTGGFAMKAKRLWKKMRMGALAAGISAALLVPAPPVAEASILVDVITGAIGAGTAYHSYLDGILKMGNDPVVQKKLFDKDTAERGADESEENRVLVDSVMNQLIERGEYAMAADSLPFRWNVNADDSFNASCTAADYVSINRGLITALHGDRDECILSLSLQLIIENAVKHNCPQNSIELHVSLSRQGNMLVIKNNRIYANHNNDQSVESYGIGISNLKQRYRLEGEAEPEFVASQDAFEVRLPIIKRKQ